MSRLVEIVAARLFAGKLLKTDTDNLMPHRYSFPAYQQNSTPLGNSSMPPIIGDGHSGDGRSGDGQSVGRKMTPSPFVPNYSGDGHGKRTGWSGDGQGSEPQPVWSGGGRHDVLNPMMPTWGNQGNLQAGNGQLGRNEPGRPQLDPFQASQHGFNHATTSSGGNRFGQRAADNPALASTATREEPTRTRQVQLSEELMMNVNVGSGDGAVDKMKTARKSSGTWKLIALVVVFLVWVSTASTLLFLYMDRYLFP